MSKPTRDERWRDAALTGRFTALRAVVSEMVAQNWPQQVGHIYMREYGKPGEQSEAEDRRDYADFAADLYLKKYFHGALHQRIEHRDAIRAIAGEHYNVSMKPDYPVTAEGAKAYGVQMAQDFQYASPKAGGGFTQETFRISSLNIGAHKCAHCATNVMAKVAQPDKCEIVDPDSVFKDRMDYFNTTMHELAHSIRELKGELKYGDMKEQRREENIALVFAGLMQAKVFGTAGMLALRTEAIRQYGDSGEEAVRYEAVGPMLAAIKFVDDKQQAGMAKLSPRDLLSAAVKLVDDNDLTRGMTPEQEQAFSDFLKHADRRPEVAGTRRQNLTKPTEDGLTRNFTIIAQKPDGGLEMLHESTPYLPQMAALDEAFTRYGTLESSLREAQMRLNPLRPAAMARDVYQTSDPTGFYDPKWQAALFEFNKGFNHPSCDIPAIFKKDMDELDAVRAESKREAQKMESGAKNAAEAVTLPAALQGNSGENTKPAGDEAKQQHKAPPPVPGAGP